VISFLPVDGTRRKRLLHSSPKEKVLAVEPRTRKKKKKQRRGRHSTTCEKQDKAFA
jgi:hypothetical protein